MNRIHLAAAATIVAGWNAPALAGPLSDAESGAIIQSVDRLTPSLASTAQDVWRLAEVGFKENKSSALLQKQLKDAGFRIETGISGIPTAFVATAGSGGPVLALLAEYDALPGLSQDKAGERKSLGGIAGHACGHNLLGAASVTAAIALKQWLERTGTKGTIRLYGSPAEEGGFAKVYFVRDGLFKDVDAALTWHPSGANSASQGTMLSMLTAKFRFDGVASHAAAAPDRGRSALDAVEIHNVAVNYLREHVPQETRIHYTITNGGDQPNIVPAHAESFYYIRHYDPAVVQDVWDRVQKAAEGAALATGTKVTVEVIGGSYAHLPNDALGKIVYANLEKVGGYTYTPEEAAYARQISASLNAKTAPDPSRVEPYQFGRKSSASSDVGDITWVVPTSGLGAATWVPGTAPHSWQAASASGTTIGVKGAVVAAKTLALTGAQLFQSPDALAAARAEFQKSRGADFVYKPLLGDRAPALDYTDKP
ncbi:aminobenzoyl-glutamate utilization protein B [Sphingomonas zeicaulis]|uniref:amidohydrolase n=1 Tax=Sphingomonas zeicaulis TaxID=1632740 RepID=UPI003D236E71